MSVTLFAAGVVISDEMADRLSGFSEAVILPWYLNTHNGELPTGWPSPASHKTLAEWGIKQLAKSRLEQWERKQAESALQTTPWSGGDVEGIGR